MSYFILVDRKLSGWANLKYRPGTNQFLINWLMQRYSKWGKNILKPGYHSKCQNSSVKALRKILMHRSIKFNVHIKITLYNLSNVKNNVS